MRWLLVWVALGACSFDHGALSSPGSADASDATEADATSQDVASVTCPNTYVDGRRLVATATGWLVAEQTCESDLPGATHLVVLDDDAERAAVTTAIQSLGDAWVGIVRDPGGTAPWPWRYVTGGSAAYAPWEGTEPNNMSGDQYVAVLRQTSGFLYDYGANNLVYAVCECDFKPPINADFDPNTN